MTRRGSPAVRRLAPWLLVAVIGAIPASTRSESPLPLAVEDVRSGRATELVAGPELLHVVVFATWCPPCVDEFERLADLERRWGESGYRLVLIAVENRHTRERLLKFADRREPPGTLLFDATGQAQRSLGVTEFPAHVVFDATGNELFRTDGLSDELEQQIGSFLRRAEGGR